ncbi:hypothetical protein GFL58_13705 [Rhizobium leguminosarum bv. viciae]|uniref:DUF6634 family protein n=1 Tax=Rhizobium leguminosarum TaxID=384 RepID=UPI00143FA782|nr:DUF6634 family protein [Rhizobium leguminosarum]NKM62057.1 hypothetical protein [Rhizobium leguminosarum bv. viciae]
MQHDDSVFRAWFGTSGAELVEKLRRLAGDLDNIDRRVDTIAPKAAMNSWALAMRSVPCLIGRPLAHPNISDGRPAYSSELFYLDPERGIARTMSRWYRLGTRVGPEYWEERLRENGPSEYSQ